jgi:hypothetical protein
MRAHHRPDAAVEAAVQGLDLLLALSDGGGRVAAYFPGLAVGEAGGTVPVEPPVPQRGVASELGELLRARSAARTASGWAARVA